MNVIVCVKQVPDTTEIKIDPVNKTLIRAGVPSILNPFDAYAVEAALRMKDADKNTKVYVTTMGPPQAVAVLDSGSAGALCQCLLSVFRLPLRVITLLIFLFSTALAAFLNGLVVAGSIGFAKGIDVSGAGQLIADTMIHVAGPLLQTEYILCVILLVLATVMSNFMSNNACVTILIPICFALSVSLGFNPIPLVLAITVGANICMATPICTACITMSTVVGYRFKDYFRIGGVMNIIATVAAAAALYVVYYI